MAAPPPMSACACRRSFSPGAPKKRTPTTGSMNVASFSSLASPPSTLLNLSVVCRRTYRAPKRSSTFSFIR